MMKLDNFVGMMTGHFDNKDQFNKMQAEGKTYPYAEHVNTICNDKINNLPEDFKGKFVVEESYYEINGKRHASPHLFLIMEIEQGIGPRITSSLRSQRSTVGLEQLISSAKSFCVRCKSFRSFLICKLETIKMIVSIA